MTRPQIDNAAHNAAIYESSKLADWFASLPIYPAERAVFERYPTAFVGKRVLDLAVGSGRTTPTLEPKASDYLGVDLSTRMLEVARRRNPQVDFRQMDVRDIATLGPDQFDFVMASCAILSAFTHGERLRVFGAIREVLAPGGIFVFTAHNRRWREAGAPPINRRSWRPRRLARGLYPPSWINYLRLRSMRREEADYAILIDSAHYWRCIFYFIDRDAQVRQAAAAGFEVLEVFGEDGTSLPEGADTSASGLLQYVCRTLKRDADRKDTVAAAVAPPLAPSI